MEAITTPRRGRPKKSPVIDGSASTVQDVSTGDSANGQDGIHTIRIEAVASSKGKGRDWADLVNVISQKESELPAGVTIVKVWSSSNEKEFNGTRSSAPVEIGEDAYQVNTGEIYSI